MFSNKTQIRFEEHLVRWLLKRYGLYDTRTRYMILDVEREWSDAESDAPCPLTLRAFNRFFDFQFPIRLEPRCLKQNEVGALKTYKVLTELGKTRFGRDLVWIEENSSDGSNMGLVYHFPYQNQTGQSLVLHNRLGIDDRVPGPHFVFRFEDQTCCVIETLAGLLTSVDAEIPPERWQRSAIRAGFATPVSSNDSTANS